MFGGCGWMSTRPRPRPGRWCWNAWCRCRSSPCRNGVVPLATRSRGSPDGRRCSGSRSRSGRRQRGRVAVRTRASAIRGHLYAVPLVGRVERRRRRCGRGWSQSGAVAQQRAVRVDAPEEPVGGQFGDSFFNDVRGLDVVGAEPGVGQLVGDNGVEEQHSESALDDDLDAIGTGGCRSMPGGLGDAERGVPRDGGRERARTGPSAGLSRCRVGSGSDGLPVL